MLIFCSHHCGNGFGNEFLWVSKALLCSKTFGVKYWREIRPWYMKSGWVPPYDEIFPSILHDKNKIKYIFEYLWYKLTYKYFRFGEDELIATGEVKIERAVEKLLEKYKIKKTDRCLIVFDMMRPGIESVAHQAGYLKYLLFENGWLQHKINLKREMLGLDQEKFSVGLHIRLDDFDSPLPLGQEWPEGKHANIQIPLDWYEHICDLFEKTFPGKVQFLVFSNGNDEQLQSLTDKYCCIKIVSGAARSADDVVDLFMLAGCDLIVSSVSWFSGWAVLFSEKPFIWYKCAHGAPNFIYPTDENNHVPFCYPIATENELPSDLIDYINKTLNAKSVNTNYIVISEYM